MGGQRPRTTAPRTREDQPSPPSLGGADVSRTFLYQNPAARQLVEEAATAASGQRVLAQAEQAAQLEATWRERALNAEDALARANEEVSLQRNTIGQLLGKIRDLEQDLPEDCVQRIVTENTTLKQKVRQLGQDTRRPGTVKQRGSRAAAQKGTTVSRCGGGVTPSDRPPQGAVVPPGGVPHLRAEEDGGIRSRIRDPRAALRKWCAVRM
ncbi:hypothetical protein [Amycolatopsis anabasis]|uniref:hypothetical protein n=1 Tax=Amycolatopsis anabasis TaxID=1840409 RepID=UPI0015D2DA2F|nr:hypothetical protein [Amycolatopsis anabasis]